MARTPVVTAIPDDDRQRDAALRPKFLRSDRPDGSRARRLAIAVNAAKKLKEPLGHILFDGPPGLGKTTFATVLPNELGTSIQMTSGPALSKPADLLAVPDQPRRSGQFCSSTRSTACRGLSKSSSIRRWRIFASISCSAKG